MYILMNQTNWLSDKLLNLSDNKPFTGTALTVIWRDSDGKFFDSSSTTWGNSPVFNSGAIYKSMGVFSFALASNALIGIEGDIIRWVMTDNILEASVTISSQGGYAKILAGDALNNTVWTDSRAALIDTLSSIPTTAALADAIWDELRLNHTVAGTFGQAIQEVLGSPNSNAIAMWDSLALSHVTAGTFGAYLRDILWAFYNRRKVDTTAKTETIYKDDGSTPHQVFDLKNSALQPSSVDVFEKVPR